jgi:inosine/xanthosine triphosphate pyrophosphatase family protein
MRPIGDKLVIATHNPGKLREIAELIEPLGISCVSAADLGLPVPEEIGNTFVDNADLKARAAGLHFLRAQPRLWSLAHSPLGRISGTGSG